MPGCVPLHPFSAPPGPFAHWTPFECLKNMRLALLALVVVAAMLGGAGAGGLRW